MRPLPAVPPGRDAEVRRAVDALQAPPEGIRLVLIQGEAGIGKTTVFNAVVRAVVPELSIRAAEMERDLPYAALSDLLGPSLATALPGLHPARAEALSAALQLGTPGLGAPDGRAVALATHDVLATLLAGGPLTIAIDDVQWLDQETATCLSFAIRRLSARGLGVLLAMRSGSASGLPLGLPREPDTITLIELEPLPSGLLGSIVTEHLGRALPRPTLARVHEMSRGNPLLALELARTLPDDAGPDDLPTAPDVERLIGRRVRELNRVTIELLLLAAAASRPTVDLLAEASGMSTPDCAHGLGADATDGLVNIDNGIITFAHPLFTSAVLRSVSPGARVEAHRRLAGVTQGQERALHLAEAAAGPDEEVAAIIEAAAADAARRGAPASAAALLERAASLSPELESGGRRRIASARLYALAGDGGRARRLNLRAVAELPPGATRARARAALFTPAVTEDEFGAALADAGDDQGACAAVRWIHSQCLFLRLDFPASVSSAERAITHAEQAGDRSTQIAAMVHVGFVRNALDPEAGLEILHAAAALSWIPLSAYDSAETAIAMNQTVSDHLELARPALEELATRCHTSGDEAGLGGIALHRVELEARAGDLGAARRWMQIRREVAAGDGDWQSPYIQDYLEALLLGREGDGEGAVTVGLRGRERAAANGDWAFSQLLAHTAAVGHLQCGRPQDALDLLSGIRELRAAVGLGEPGIWRYEGPEIEALVDLARFEEARRRIDELDELGRRLDRPRLVGEALFGEGLLLGVQGEPAAGVDALTEAISTFDGAALPWERERARLALGIALRRVRERTKARSTLARAAAEFDRMGAPGWAEQARREAERISGRTRSEAQLTPIEVRVADLVATGLTNKQVAAELFLSPKTVESHLSRIYAKTGVKSRTELAAARLGQQP